MPPVANTTAGASNRMKFPVSRVAHCAGDLGLPFPRRSARPLVQDQLGDAAFVEDLDPGLVVTEFGLVFLLQRNDLLLHGADDLQAGAVADVREPRIGVAAEVALADPAVLGAVEQGAVGLEFPHPVGGFPGVQLGHPPVVEELAATHGVGEVDLPGVLRVGVLHGSCTAALGHHGVRLAEE
jgi:hypothetical protein